MTGKLVCDLAIDDSSRINSFAVCLNWRLSKHRRLLLHWIQNGARRNRLVFHYLDDARLCHGFAVIHRVHFIFVSFNFLSWSTYCRISAVS